MANGERDDNRVVTLLGVSSADGVTPVPIQVNPVTGRIRAELAVGAGDMLTATYDPAGIAEQLVGLTAAQTMTTKTMTSVILNVGVSGSAVLDDDTMATASSTTLATSESIKAYVDSQITAEDFWDRSGTGLIPNTAGDSIGLTGTRISKGWFTDVEVTNAIAASITGNAATVTTITGLAPDTATTQAAQAAITSVGSLTSLDVVGNITVGGTVDGRDIASDGGKLDGIEAAADVTDTANVNAAGATMNADTTLAGNGYFLDDDAFAANDATKVASQQSIKAYVDTQDAALTRTLQQVFDAGQTITIADTDNQTLAITNNDTTNNPVSVTLTNNTTNDGITIDQVGILGAADDALKVSSNTLQTTSGGLVRFILDLATSTARLLYLDQDGLGDGLFIDKDNSGVSLNIDQNANDANDLFGIQMEIDNAGAGTEYAMRFNGSEIVSAAIGGSQDKKIRCSVGGTDYFIPLHTA